MISITVENINKKYGNIQILKGVTFNAASGDCVCITGRNGCGKTTLLSILNGNLKADSGTVEIAGDNKKIGYLPQTNPLIESATVKDNLKLWCTAQDEFDKIADRFELRDHLKKKVSQLSGGMKRRLSLACAMTGNPGLLIMDEPTAALDIEYKKLIHLEMGKYIANGGLIIMVTHEKEEIDMGNKRVAL